MKLRFASGYGFGMTYSLTTVRASCFDVRKLLIVCVAIGCFGLTGCRDGPLYAMKSVNPYFALKQWRDDEALGVTDHERRRQLTELSEQIAGMSAERQAFWAGHLTKIMENDTSPEMRRLAVVTAGKLNNNSAIPLIEKGLDDESLKVRLYACKALGGRSGEQSARLLASTAGTETNEDVRQAALSALSQHKNPIAIDALRIALSDRNPATRDLAMNSLRNVTGNNYGKNPDTWIAALDKQSKPSEQPKTMLR